MLEQQPKIEKENNDELEITPEIRNAALLKYQRENGGHFTVDVKKDENGEPIYEYYIEKGIASIPQYAIDFKKELEEDSQKRKPTKEQIEYFKKLEEVKKNKNILK